MVSVKKDISWTPASSIWRLHKASISCILAQKSDLSAALIFSDCTALCSRHRTPSVAVFLTIPYVLSKIIT
jgi:hypothetical protein